MEYNDIKHTEIFKAAMSLSIICLMAYRSFMRHKNHAIYQYLMSSFTGPSVLNVKLTKISNMLYSTEI